MSKDLWDCNSDDFSLADFKDSYRSAGAIILTDAQERTAFHDLQHDDTINGHFVRHFCWTLPDVHLHWFFAFLCNISMRDWMTATFAWRARPNKRVTSASWWGRCGASCMQQ